VRTKYRGLRGGEVAQLVKQALETRDVAILGPRGGTPGRAVEQPKADHVFIRSADEKKAA